MIYFNLPVIRDPSGDARGLERLGAGQADDIGMTENAFLDDKALARGPGLQAVV